MAVPYLGYASVATEQDPLLKGLRGFGATQSLVGQNIQNQALMQQTERDRIRQEALRGYGQTGDLGALMKADPEAGIKMTAAQMQIANAAAEYWDSTKSGLTREVYPKWRDETLRRFPNIPTTQFPPAEQFKTDQDFESWKYQKELMAARFKAMSGVGQYTPKAVGGKIWDPVTRTFIDPGISQAKEQEFGYKERGLGLKEKGLGLKEDDLNIKRQKEQREAGSKPRFDDFIKQPGIAELTYPEQVKRFNQSISEGKESGKTVKPLTPKQITEGKIADQKLKLMKQLGGEAETTNINGQQYMLPKNGVMVPVTKEVYDAYQAHYGQQ